MNDHSRENEGSFTWSLAAEKSRLDDRTPPVSNLTPEYRKSYGR
jgi:hypothetical protein